MQKIGNITSTATPAGEFTNGVVSQGIVPTLIDDKWLNTIQRELVKVVEASGLKLDPSDDTQVWQAIKLLSKGGIQIATDADIVKGIAGKLVDAAGLRRRTDDGRQPPFSADFAAAIGGYPKGAILLGSDGETLWQSTADANTTDPDSATSSGWVRLVSEEILHRRFAIIYPNGGTASNPAKVGVNKRYVMANPFGQNDVLCFAEIMYNSQWGRIEFSQSYEGRGGVGICVAQVGGSIIVQTGSFALTGSSAGTGNPFDLIGGGVSGSVNTAPCRVKVFQIS